MEQHLAIEMALLRVRHRHEKAGDAHKYTFGELLKEASKELDEASAPANANGTRYLRPSDSRYLRIPSERRKLLSPTAGTYPYAVSKTSKDAIDTAWLHVSWRRFGFSKRSAANIIF